MFKIPAKSLFKTALLTILMGVIVLWTLRTGQCAEKGAAMRKPLPSAAEIAKLPTDGGKEFNRLIFEKSPYLLQHARNPVNWYPWGKAAFAKAKKDGKPIFLSIGYSTCHWCHVMEHESFENADVAAILNKRYVAIKVDREERPDIDEIYMTATQLMTGRGGWPNSLWLKADGAPWYAGTYWPREDRGGYKGFKTRLVELAEVWKTRRADVDKQAEVIAKALKDASGKLMSGTDTLVSHELVSGSLEAVIKNFDAKNGGFGTQPKFPPHGTLRLLMAQLERKKNAEHLKVLTTTLDAMANGGIHDQVGGGFHRYSTDATWLVPHFEKMLYDNAQLARAYAQAWKLTRNDVYRDVALDTYGWVLREMTDPKGGFYSALDADSDGEEGKFYVWRKDEILKILGAEEGELFCSTYGVAADGNFEDEATGKRSDANILHLSKPIATEALSGRMEKARAKLLAVRIKRIWPHRDDKVIVAWNGLMIASLAYGGKTLEEPRLIAAAEKAADFILTKMRKDGRLIRSWRKAPSDLKAYLDDYAFLADGLLELHSATGKERWLKESVALVKVLDDLYWDESDGGYFFTADDHEKLLLRSKDPFESAMPSGNGVAAQVLVRLAKLTGKKGYLEHSKKITQVFMGIMSRTPKAGESLLMAAAMQLDVAAATTAPPAGDVGKADVTGGEEPVKAALYARQLSVAPSAAIDIAIRLDIQKGFHVNSRKPLQEYLIPTILSLKETKAAALGKVTYPDGKKETFKFSKVAMSVYDGTVWIRGRVKLAKDVKPGKINLEFQVETQPCSTEQCLFPRTIVLPLTIEIVPDALAAKARHPKVFAE
jgi:uncharacterized protein